MRSELPGQWPPSLQDVWYPRGHWSYFSLQVATLTFRDGCEGQWENCSYFSRVVDSQIQFKIHIKATIAKPHVEYLSVVGNNINYDARSSCILLGNSLLLSMNVSVLEGYLLPYFWEAMRDMCWRSLWSWFVYLLFVS